MAEFSITNLISKIVAIIGGMMVTTPLFRTSVMPEDIIVDFIIVGSGSAGSAVAGRLSEVAEWDVLVFETGGQPRVSTVVPLLNFASILGNTTDSSDYPLHPQKYSKLGFKDEAVYKQGKVIGGSSTINQMTFHRGNPRDYDHWAELGNEGWDYQTVLQYYKKLETYRDRLTASDAPYRGTEGPVSVEKVRWTPPVGKVAIEAGKEMGLEEIDYNAGRFIGSSLNQLTAKNGERVSSADAFLKPNLHRRNLKLQINSRVIEIILNNENRAIGVKYVHNNKIKRAFAQKEVILSAGAADSPKLLMLSGIGPKKHLEQHGIEVRAEVPGVGQNSQDHVMTVGIFWTIHPRVSSTILSRLSFQALREYSEERKGPLSVPIPICAMYAVNTGSSNDSSIPDISISMLNILFGGDYGLLATYAGFKDSVTNGFFRPSFGRPGYSLNPMLARPKSRGTVTLMSKNPFDPPIIDPNSLSHPDDVEVLVKGAKASLAIGNADAFRRKLGAKPNTIPLPGCDHLEYHSDDYWRCFVRSLSGAMAHISGTCKMAPSSDPTGVVSPRLKVRGVQNLRVIDASIMPEITSGNTNAPAIMIGVRGADLIKEDYGKI